MQELFPESTVGWTSIAVDRPIGLGSAFTYAVPEDLADLRIGDPVSVPLGRGATPTAGWVTSRVSMDQAPPDQGGIKHILARRPDRPLPEDLIELGCWMADYYLAPLGPTLSSMLPAPVRRGTGRVERTYLDLAPSADETPRLGPAQRQVLNHLRSLPPDARPVEQAILKAAAGISTTTPIKSLVSKGLLVQTTRSTIASSWHVPPTEPTQPPTPTRDQTAIIDALQHQLGQGFAAHLLRGVTGSGKTEVYLRVIEAALRRNEHVLILVPEIALTPQTGSRIAERFPHETVAILHSGMPAAARHACWEQARTGEARIVLGARSAVFAPIPHDRLGLIIVDESHDPSFKQDASPRYHGRDVAVRRAQMAACPVVLCTATPSLETWWNVTHRPHWSVHHLGTRAPGLTLPRVRVVDMREERRADQGRRGQLGPTLRAALVRTLEQEHQAILLLNRRGWATHIACPSAACGWVLECGQCDTTMVYHRPGEVPTGGFVRCHHCSSEIRLPKACPDCGRRPARLGAGTQRLEDELAALHPELSEGAAMVRMDSDAMQHADQYHAALSAFERGDTRVLLGTQMIAKGLDVPGVRLVGVIDADTALRLPDFRAAERTFQLVSQVTGRCGRGAAAGQAIVQTVDPDARAMVMAAKGNTIEFLNAELQDRVSAGLPPATRMARLVEQHEDLSTCESRINRLASSMRAIAPPEGDVMGPMPCPLARIRMRHRREVILTAPEAATLQAWLRHAEREAALRSPSLAIDVDPISLL